MKAAASAWEFRHRYWIFGACFTLSFWMYYFDSRNLGQAIADLLHHGHASLDAIRAVYLIGVALAFVAAALRTWATAYLRPEVMVDGRLHTETLVSSGPYRHLRNPLYFATNLLALGYAVMASRLGAALLIASVIWFDYRLILREERELSRVQGAAYKRYCQAVPRLWPSLRPRIADSRREPAWGAAVLGEMFFWLLGAGLLTFTWTFSLRAFFLVLGLSVGAYFLCLGILGRRRRPSRTPSS